MSEFSAVPIEQIVANADTRFDMLQSKNNNPIPIYSSEYCLGYSFGYMQAQNIIELFNQRIEELRMAKEEIYHLNKEIESLKESIEAQRKALDIYERYIEGGGVNYNEWNW